jgi:hypothetical protein
LKLQGAGYVTVTKLHVDTAQQKPDIISCFLSQILWMLDSVFPCHPTSPKDTLPFNGSKIVILLLKLSASHAAFDLGEVP